jgi:hypothetical protein
MTTRYTYTTLLNKVIKLKQFHKQEHFDNVCTKIYVLNLNTDDDKLIMKSLLENKFYYNISNYLNKNNYKNSYNNNNNNKYNKHKCCKFNCCKSLDN